METVMRGPNLADHSTHGPAVEGQCKKPDTVEELSYLMREKMTLAKDLHMTNRHISELRNQGEAIKARLAEIDKGIKNMAELFDRETNWQ